MEIKGIENMSLAQIGDEIQRGGKFVVFESCISLLIVSFKLPSSVYFIRSGEGTMGKSIRFTIISLFLGWWGIPWGPIYTIWSFVTNFSGGKDVTLDVMNALDDQNRVFTAN